MLSHFSHIYFTRCPFWLCHRRLRIIAARFATPERFSRTFIAVCIFKKYSFYTARSRHGVTSNSSSHCCPCLSALRYYKTLLHTGIEPVSHAPKACAPLSHSKYACLQLFRITCGNHQSTVAVCVFESKELITAIWVTTPIRNKRWNSVAKANLFTLAERHTVFDAASFLHSLLCD